MPSPKWNTSITEILPNEIRLRGYRVDDLMGELTFTEAIYLTLFGNLPTKNITRLLDAILVSTVDHGVTPPSALAARNAISTGAPLNAAVASGILAINNYHGGAIYNCMGVIQEGLDLFSKNSLTIKKSAQKIVSNHILDKKRIPGFGHRIHTNDPRTTKLFSLAADLDLSGNGVAILVEMKSALSSHGKELPINVDGAIAGLLIDLGVPRELANAFFFMARVPGLVAHAHEEMSTQRPMRKINSQDHQYNGPESRGLID